MHTRRPPLQLRHSRWMNGLGYDLTAVQEDILRFEGTELSVSVLAVDGVVSALWAVETNYVQKLSRL